MSDQTPALEVAGIRKVYGGEVALAGASLSVARGEIHGLLGANGAGKSTLVRIICGVERQDHGTVTIAGEQLPVPHHAATVRERGLAHIDQDRALVGDLSIGENMALTMGYPMRRGLVDWSAVLAQAKRALERVGLDHHPSEMVNDLPIADQTLVAIARALAIDARLIMLDEPTANLGAADSERLYERLKTLASEGVAAVLITHALAEALQVCHRVTVLRDGEMVGTRTTSELSEDELTTMVLGRRMVEMTRHANGAGVAATRPVCLALHAAHADRLGPLSLEARAGEIVGITGLADSGHLLLGDLLAGMIPLDDGEMTIDGAPYLPKGPFGARQHGVACLPPDRVRDGLAVQMSARENLYFDGRGVGSRWGIPRRRETAAAGEVLATARVRPPDPEAIMSTLSGGNMQKVLMAKWLATSPRVLVLCEPTVGVDVGARADIYGRLHEACESGVAILLVSSDFEEVADLSDRVIVVRYGSPVARLEANQVSVELLAALASGGKERAGSA